MTHAFIHTVKLGMFTTLLFVSFIGLTHNAHAYFTTNQTEIDFGNGTGLFLIEYSFGMAQHEVQLPVLAHNSSSKKSDVVEFSILNSTNEVANGVTNAFVLSSAKLTDDIMYKTEKGVARTFTLIVFFTPETKGAGEYRLQVTSLPFNWDGVQQLQLNQSELKYYTTKPLKL